MRGVSARSPLRRCWWAVSAIDRAVPSRNAAMPIPIATGQPRSVATEIWPETATYRAMP